MSPFSCGSFTQAFGDRWKNDIGVGPERDSPKETSRVGDYRGMSWQWDGHLFGIASAYVEMVKIDHSV